MISNIKSIYFLEKLFEHIKEGRKIELVRYNKNLQKQLDIKIRKYKINLDYYTIGERNGKCKEYDCYTNILLFEGEYLNGKRNGKGKEYNYYKEERNDNEKTIQSFSDQYLSEQDKDILLFVGEYLNGKRSGNGKEYDKDGNLVFEGEYLDDKKWNGTEYIY